MPVRFRLQAPTLVIHLLICRHLNACALKLTNFSGYVKNIKNTFLPVALDSLKKIKLAAPVQNRIKHVQN
ncbi:MAG: hypothetical protein A2V65_10890 [Deltaproteobacteria bacterium RBG_13_49_15]|nr:MAG: hypothetical protein A2V65_10890 [Deltaproteobacteria bacterium RBG_13_49_15]